MKNLYLKIASKTLLKVLSLVLLMHANIYSAELPTSRGFSPMLGQGYINERQDLVGECLTGEPVFEGSPEASVLYTSSISEQQLASELGVSVGGKARLGLISAGASASFFNASRSDAYSISAIYTGTYFFKNRIFKNPQLKPEYKNYVDGLNSEKWREACGEEFVVQQSLGAKLFFSIRIDFLSEQERSSFAANFSFDAPFASVNTSVSQAMSGLSKRTRVTINVLQVGGKVDRITEIFRAKVGTDENSEGTSKAYRFVQCSSGQLEQCKSVLEQAISYATDTRNGFPSQISPDFLSNPQSDGGPAVLSSITRSYKAANVFFDVTAELNQQMKLSRQLISKIYESAYTQYNQVRRIVRSGIIRLSAAQRERFTEMETYLFSALQRITESSLRCYQYPKQCGDAYSDLSEALPDGVKLFNKNEFLIEPEIFSQYCDLGQSPLSEKSLANTISAMIQVARQAGPDLFTPTYEGAAVDVCNAAEIVFSRTSELSFPRKKNDSNETRKVIEDLRPIAVLTHLKTLSLRGNLLSSVTELKSLKSLERLDLADNNLTEIDALNELVNLTHIDLSDNHIQNTSSLASLSRLKKLDLRNNESEIKCPFQEQTRCLTADFRTNNSFIQLAKFTQTPRIAHAASQLDDGRVLVTGGMQIGLNTTIRAELYDPKRGTFTYIGEQVKPRYYHTSTKLNDGSVLLIGGWGRSASRSAELFSPNNEAFDPTEGKPLTARAQHSATLLKNGNVLIAGGWSNTLGNFKGDDSTLTVEIYDPNSQRFSRAASMKTPRAAHRATQLSDGRVLVTGGYASEGSLTTAEIYDPMKDEWLTARGRMHRGRGEHTATLMQDGRVFIAGGFNGSIGVDRAEIFDPKTESFTELENSMSAARAEHESLLLSDGKILLLGGRQQNILYSDSDFDGRVVSGGHDTAEIFDPISKLFTVLSNRLHSQRAIFSATQVSLDRILIVGGLGGFSNLSAELFEYAP